MLCADEMAECDKHVEETLEEDTQAVHRVDRGRCDRSGTPCFNVVAERSALERRTGRTDTQEFVRERPKDELRHRDLSIQSEPRDGRIVDERHARTSSSTPSGCGVRHAGRMLEESIAGRVRDMMSIDEENPSSGQEENEGMDDAESVASENMNL